MIPEPKPNPPYTCDTSGRCTPIEPGTGPEPTPEPEPEPPQECSHEGLGPDVCRPVEDSEQEDEEVVEEDEEEQQEEEEPQEETADEESAETSE